jgi:hypothetical protein
LESKSIKEKDRSESLLGEKRGKVKMNDEPDAHTQQG